MLDFTSRMQHIEKNSAAEVQILRLMSFSIRKLKVKGIIHCNQRQIASIASKMRES